MKLAKLIDGVPVEYLAGQLRRDFPNVSWPREPAADDLAVVGVYIVQEVNPPAVQSGEVVVAGLELVEGVVRRTWTVQAVQLPVPLTAERYKMLIAMKQADLLTAVEALVAQAPEEIQVAWGHAGTFRRTSPAVAAIGAALNLTSGEIDDLFRFAETVQI